MVIEWLGVISLGVIGLGVIGYEVIRVILDWLINLNVIKSTNIPLETFCYILGSKLVYGLESTCSYNWLKCTCKYIKCVCNLIEK